MHLLLLSLSPTAATPRAPTSHLDQSCHPNCIPHLCSLLPLPLLLDPRLQTQRLGLESLSARSQYICATIHVYATIHPAIYSATFWCSYFVQKELPQVILLHHFWLLSYISHFTLPPLLHSHFLPPLPPLSPTPFPPTPSTSPSTLTLSLQSWIFAVPFHWKINILQVKCFLPSHQTPMAHHRM